MVVTVVLRRRRDNDSVLLNLRRTSMLLVPSGETAKSLRVWESRRVLGSVKEGFWEVFLVACSSVNLRALVPGGGAARATSR